MLKLALMINKHFIILLLTISITVSSSLVLAEEKSETTNPILSTNRWTETLRFKDFILLPGFIEVKDKLDEYRNVLAKNYKNTPSVFSTAIEYGLFLIDTGDLNKAEEVWNKAVTDFIANPTPLVYKAWVDACKGNYKSAKEIWIKIANEKLDISSNVMWFPYQVHSVLGLYLIKDYLPPNDKEEVTGIINKIIVQSQRSPGLVAIAFTNYLHDGKIKEVTERLDKLLIRYPEQAIFHVLLGIARLMEGKYEEAISAFDTANKIYPYSPTSHLMKGRALQALKRKKEASNEIEQAIKLDPLWQLTKVKKSKLLAQKNYLIPAKHNKTIKESRNIENANVPES